MTTKEKLLQIPVLCFFIKLLDKVKIKHSSNISLYDLIELYLIGIVKGALTSRAGSIAFSFFMALFPFVLFIFTLIPFIPIENFQNDFLYLIEQALPPKTAESADYVIKDIANNAYGGLLSSVFVLSIFLMTNGINALFSGFEYTYHTIKVRSMFKQYIWALVTSLIMALLLLLTVAVIIYFEIAIENLKARSYLTDDIFWIEIGKNMILLFMLLVSVATMYYFGTTEGNKFRFFSAGAIFSTLLIIVNFKIFGFYISTFGKYNELYGIIGTVLIIMLFIWLNSIILLLGYELNASRLGLKKKVRENIFKLKLDSNKDNIK